jgi:hypothetical protein
MLPDYFVGLNTSKNVIRRHVAESAHLPLIIRKHSGNVPHEASISIAAYSCPHFLISVVGLIC